MICARAVVAALVLAVALAASCAAPSRTAFARHPDALAEPDRAGSDPRALEIADRVFAAAGGASWARARQLRWSQTVTDGGAVAGPDGGAVAGPDAAAAAAAAAAHPEVRDHVWDRWNGRHRTRTRRAATCTGARCEARDDRAVVLVFDVYGPGELAYGEEDGAAFPIDKVTHGSGGPRASWNQETALLCLPFLLRDPGARLAYAGTTHDAGAAYEELRLSFPSDPTRAGRSFQLLVDPATHVIARVAVEAADPGGSGGSSVVGLYELSNPAISGGLSFSTLRTELGSGAVTRITELSVTSRVDDSLFDPPLALRYYRR